MPRIYKVDVVYHKQGQFGGFLFDAMPSDRALIAAIELEAEKVDSRMSDTYNQDEWNELRTRHNQLKSVIRIIEVQDTPEGSLGNPIGGILERTLRYGPRMLAANEIAGYIRYYPLTLHSSWAPPPSQGVNPVAAVRVS